MCAGRKPNFTQVLLHLLSSYLRNKNMAIHLVETEVKL